MLVKQLFICILSRNFKNEYILRRVGIKTYFSSSSFYTGSSPIQFSSLFASDDSWLMFISENSFFGMPKQLLRLLSSSPNFSYSLSLYVTRSCCRVFANKRICFQQAQYLLPILTINEITLCSSRCCFITFLGKPRKAMNHHCIAYGIKFRTVENLPLNSRKLYQNQ